MTLALLVRQLLALQSQVEACLEAAQSLLKQEESARSPSKEGAPTPSNYQAFGKKEE